MHTKLPFACIRGVRGHRQAFHSLQYAVTPHGHAINPCWTKLSCILGAAGPVNGRYRFLQDAHKAAVCKQKGRQRAPSSPPQLAACSHTPWACNQPLLDQAELHLGCGRTGQRAVPFPAGCTQSCRLQANGASDGTVNPHTACNRQSHPIGMQSTPAGPS